MYFWLKHSGARVLTNTRIDKDSATELTLDTAKNMVVCAQICMRENWNFDKLTIVIGWNIYYNKHISMRGD